MFVQKQCLMNNYRKAANGQLRDCLGNVMEALDEYFGRTPLSVSWDEEREEWCTKDVGMLTENFLKHNPSGADPRMLQARAKVPEREECERNKEHSTYGHVTGRTRRRSQCFRATHRCGQQRSEAYGVVFGCQLCPDVTTLLRTLALRPHFLGSGGLLALS
jgi:hypothetical protein